MLFPLASGVGSDTVIVEFMPPPKGCEGAGVDTPSSDVPMTVTDPPPVIVTLWLAGEVTPLKSATPAAAGYPVTSMSRNRSLVTGAPVLFKYDLLITSVPSVYGPAAGPGLVPLRVSVYELVLRTRFGAAVAATLGSITPDVKPLNEAGENKFSGPGAPSVGVRLLPTAVNGVVDTSRKSTALLSVSFGVPSVGILTKLYCDVLPPAGGNVPPSRSRSHVPPVFPPNPTASSLFEVLIA
jgi:hypothetical protein